MKILNKKHFFKRRKWLNKKRMKGGDLPNVLRKQKEKALPGRCLLLFLFFFNFFGSFVALRL